MGVNLKTVRCCANCRYFVFGNGYSLMLDGIPMHCSHPQFLKAEYKKSLKKTEMPYDGIFNSHEYFAKKAYEINPYNYCKNWWS